MATVSPDDLNTLLTVGGTAGQGDTEELNSRHSTTPAPVPCPDFPPGAPTPCLGDGLGINMANGPQVPFGERGEGTRGPWGTRCGWREKQASRERDLRCPGRLSLSCLCCHRCHNAQPQAQGGTTQITFGSWNGLLSPCFQAFPCTPPASPGPSAPNLNDTSSGNPSLSPPCPVSQHLLTAGRV